MSDFSTFLFARPSAVEGVARIIDFGNTLSVYNDSPTEEHADLRAFWADWRTVGDDIASTFMTAADVERAKRAGRTKPAAKERR